MFLKGNDVSWPFTPFLLRKIRKHWDTTFNSFLTFFTWSVTRPNDWHLYLSLVPLLRLRTSHTQRPEPTLSHKHVKFHLKITEEWIVSCFSTSEIWQKWQMTIWQSSTKRSDLGSFICTQQPIIIEYTKLKDYTSLGHRDELWHNVICSKHLEYADNTHSYLGSWRQLTESGFSRDPLLSIPKILQFLAKYCQSSQFRSSLFFLSIFIASGCGL